MSDNQLAIAETLRQIADEITAGAPVPMGIHLSAAIYGQGKVSVQVEPDQVAGWTSAPIQWHPEYPSHGKADAPTLPYVVVTSAFEGAAS